jgi:hypothetical protein
MSIGLNNEGRNAYTDADIHFLLLPIRSALVLGHPFFLTERRVSKDPEDAALSRRWSTDRPKKKNYNQGSGFYTEDPKEA